MLKHKRAAVQYFRAPLAICSVSRFTSDFVSIIASSASLLEITIRDTPRMPFL